MANNMLDLIGALDAFGAEDLLGTELGVELGGDGDLEALLSGADDLAFVGAAAAPSSALAAKVRASQNKKAMLRALAMKGGAAAVVSRHATKSRKYTQGFGPTVIAGGATVNIIVQPQVTFKGKRLVIPSDFAGVILINDLKIGNISQLPSSNPLPGRMFTEFAVGVEQDFDTAQISQQVSLSVTNTGGAPVTFTAGLLGLIVA